MRRDNGRRALDDSLWLLRAQSRLSQRVSDDRAGRLRGGTLLWKELQIGEACAGPGAGDQLQIRLAERAHELRVSRDQTKRETVRTHRHRLSPAIKGTVPTLRDRECRGSTGGDTTFGGSSLVAGL